MIYNNNLKNGRWCRGSRSKSAVAPHATPVPHPFLVSAFSPFSDENFVHPFSPFSGEKLCSPFFWGEFVFTFFWGQHLFTLFWWEHFINLFWFILFWWEHFVYHPSPFSGEKIFLFIPYPFLVGTFFHLFWWEFCSRFSGENIFLIIPPFSDEKCLFTLFWWEHLSFQPLSFSGENFSFMMSMVMIYQPVNYSYVAKLNVWVWNVWQK